MAECERKNFSTTAHAYTHTDTYTHALTHARVRRRDENSAIARRRDRGALTANRQPQRRPFCFFYLAGEAFCEVVITGIGVNSTATGWIVTEWQDLSIGCSGFFVIPAGNLEMLIVAERAKDRVRIVQISRSAIGLSRRCFGVTPVLL